MLIKLPNFLVQEHCQEWSTLGVLWQFNPLAAYISLYYVLPLETQKSENHWRLQDRRRYLHPLDVSCSSKIFGYRWCVGLTISRYLGLSFPNRGKQVPNSSIKFLPTIFSHSKTPILLSCLDGEILSPRCWWGFAYSCFRILGYKRWLTFTMVRKRRKIRRKEVEWSKADGIIKIFFLVFDDSNK